MSEDNITLWDWLVQKWNSPLWRKAARLSTAGMLATAGALFLALEPENGNWIPLFAAAVVFLVLGLRIEVPEEPLPVAPDVVESAAEAQPPMTEPTIAEAAAEERPSGGERAPAEPEIPPAVPGKRKGLLAFLRLPLAVVFAFSAQWVMDVHPMQIDTARHLGFFLYGLAFLLLGWGLLFGDAAFALVSTIGQGRGIRINRTRIIFLVMVLFFGLLAYVEFQGGWFDIMPLAALGIAVVYWCVAFADYSGGLGEVLIRSAKSAIARIRSTVTSLPNGISCSPWTLLVVLSFVVLVFTRTYDMASTPPEMTSDHIEKLINVQDILEGSTYIFFANNGGRESLEFYLVAWVSQLLGTGLSFLSLKIVSVGVGITTLPFLYLLGRELADRRVGLLAMILGGIGYWPDMMSRVGLRQPLAMLFCAVTLYFYFKAIRRRRWNDFLWAGLALGVGMYGYTSIRVVPVALAAITALFLIHPSSKGSRGWAAAGFLLTLGTMALLFIPFLRYAVDYPGDFWLRTVTRILPTQGPIPDPVRTFFENVWNALLMFSWNDGVGWFHVVPLRPALDVVTGVLFHLGFVGMVLLFFKKWSWEALSLVILVPILLLPSIMALAIPNENPSLARALAAVPVVFLLAALGMILVLDFLRSLIPGKNSRWIGTALASILIVIAAAQNFDLTLRQYPASYRVNCENASELGLFMRRFHSTIGSPQDAYLIPYPYWVDDRIVNVYAGFPILSKHVINPEDIPDFEFSGRPTLFLLLAVDVDSLELLTQRFPDGYFNTVVSSYPGHDFIYFLVPGTPRMENP